MHELKSKILISFMKRISFYVKSTYLFSHKGVDLMSEVDMLNHFNWCLNKSTKDFQLQKINIEINEEMLKTYYSFFKNILYNQSDKKKALNNLFNALDSEMKNNKYRNVPLYDILFKNMTV